MTGVQTCALPIWLRDDTIPMDVFLRSSKKSVHRVTGTAIYMTGSVDTVPHALLHNLKHNKVLHERNLFVTVQSHGVPWIGMDKRLEVTSLHHDCWQVVIHHGFKNDPDVPTALSLLGSHGCPPIDPMRTSYFLSRDSIVQIGRAHV